MSNMSSSSSSNSKTLTVVIPFDGTATTFGVWRKRMLQ